MIISLYVFFALWNTDFCNLAHKIWCKSIHLKSYLTNNEWAILKALAHMIWYKSVYPFKSYYANKKSAMLKVGHLGSIGLQNVISSRTYYRVLAHKILWKSVHPFKSYHANKKSAILKVGHLENIGLQNVISSDKWCLSAWLKLKSWKLICWFVTLYRNIKHLI